MLVLSFVIIASALASISLTVKALLRSWRVYSFARINLQRQPLEDEDQRGQALWWGDVSLTEKLYFFNLWHFTSALGEVCLILGLSIPLQRQYGTYREDFQSIDGPDAVRAMGLFLVWISLLKYLEWEKDCYVLILTIKGSITRVLKFILTVSPIYIGYIFVGTFLVAVVCGCVAMTFYVSSFTCCCLLSFSELPSLSPQALLYFLRRPSCLVICSKPLPPFLLCLMGIQFCWPFKQCNNLLILATRLLHKSIFIPSASFLSPPFSMSLFSSLRRDSMLLATTSPMRSPCPIKCASAKFCKQQPEGQTYTVHGPNSSQPRL
eukprot:m.156423 g.156423  ORF g.156423 m.156423 type:complete len:321 (+) comp24688_c0_seq9:914-1876(+)